MSQGKEHKDQNLHNVEFREIYSNANSIHQDDGISLKELIIKFQTWCKYLYSKWLIILLMGVSGGALGLTYAIIKKPIYMAQTIFVLEESEGGGGLGQYAGVASMLGVDLGSGGGGIFKGDNILELYKSRKMIQEALLAKDTFKGKPQSLIDRYLEFNKLREEWEGNPNLTNIQFNNPQNFNRTQDSIIGNLILEINSEILDVIKPDKKSSIINVTVNSEDELFAKAFANNIVNKVNAFYVNTKTKKSTENVLILQKQADSVKSALNASIGGVATAVDANPNLNPAFQRLRVGSQKKQVDVQASGVIYQEIVKNLEMAKISLRNDKPLIQVIDEPVLPLKKQKIGKFKGIIFGSIIFSFLTILFLLFKKAIVDIM